MRKDFDEGVLDGLVGFGGVGSAIAADSSADPAASSTTTSQSAAQTSSDSGDAAGFGHVASPLTWFPPA